MLRFGNKPSEAQVAGRAYLAALGVAAISCAREQGFWLRSRCELSPDPAAAKPLELVNADGTVTAAELPSANDACEIVNTAAEEARSYGLVPKKGWALELTPAQKLLTIMKLSRRINAQG
jgi:CRISPR-associated protein Csb1